MIFQTLKMCCGDVGPEQCLVFLIRDQGNSHILLLFPTCVRIPLIHPKNAIFLASQCMTSFQCLLCQVCAGG